MAFIFSDISASAGTGKRYCLLCPSVPKPRGQEAEHVSWSRLRGFIVAFFLVRKILELYPVPQKGLAILSSSMSDCSEPSPTSSKGQTRAFPWTSRPLTSTCPLFPSTYSPWPFPSEPLNRLLPLWGALPQDTLPQTQIKYCLCQFLAKWPWPSHQTFLNLSLPIYKMGQ